MSELETPPSTPGSKSGLQLLACLTGCYFVSFISIEGALKGLSDWYPMAARPPWAPPIWLFAPLWTVLYGMLGVSLWQIWTHRETDRTKAIALFVFQLLLNGAWAWIFFVAHSLLMASLDLALVWVAMGLTIAAFGRIRLSAAYLLTPQWAWITFAAALSVAMLRLNK